MTDIAAYPHWSLTLCVSGASHPIHPIQAIETVRRAAEELAG